MHKLQLFFKKKIIEKNHKKISGSSIFIYAPMIFLAIVALFYLNTYIRATEILSSNFKTSLDASSLAATSVNMDRLLNGYGISILGYAEAGAQSISETTSTQEKFKTFEEALMCNVGLKEDFSFSGGTCGWAANFLSRSGLTIDEFTIYEIVGNIVYAYQITNITQFTEYPLVRKIQIGTVEKDTDGKITKSTANTPSGEPIIYPTIYSKISFQAKAPFNNLVSYFYDVNEANNLTNTFIQSGLKVSSESVTAIKENEIDESTDKFKVFFDGNSGINSSKATLSFTMKNVAHGHSYGDLPVAERKGYLFLGWYTQPTNGQLVTPDTIFTNRIDTTLYARWQVKLDVTGWIGEYDGNEHSISVTCEDPSVVIKYGTTLGTFSETNPTASSCGTDLTVYYIGSSDNAISDTGYTTLHISHSFKEQEISDTYLKTVATCEEPGEYYYKCKGCNEKGALTYTTPAIGHSYSDKVNGSLRTEATLESPATYWDACEHCGKDSPLLSYHFYGEPLQP